MMGIKKDKVNINGQAEIFTKVVSIIIKLRDMESIYGQMGIITKVTG